jgi:2-dehydro-3-deoxy-D-arabinonate dehydratase
LSVTTGGDGFRVGVRREGRITPVTGVRSMADVLAMQRDELRSTVESASDDPLDVASVRLLVALDGQAELWCAGVTYARGRQPSVQTGSQKEVCK